MDMTASDLAESQHVPWVPGGDPLDRWGVRVSWAALLLLLLHAALAWFVRTPGYTTINDHSVYVFLARSLLDGGYNEIWRVDAPWHTQYPPLFPAFLATIIATVGDRIEVFHAAVIAWSVAGLAVMFAMVRRLWGPSLALAALAAAAVNPYLLERASEVMAEPMFITLVALSLWSLASPQPTARQLALGGFFAIAASLTRSAGLPVVVAAGVFMLLRREWKAVALYSLASAATVGAWMAYTVLAPDKVVGRSYMADAIYAGPDRVAAPPMALLLLQRVISNVPVYLSKAVPWRLPLPAVEGTGIDNALGAGLVLVGLLVGAVSVGRRWRAAAIVVLFYAMMLAVWPWRDGRFVEPMLPLLFTFCFAGWAAVGVRVWGRRGGLAALALSLLLILGAAADRTGEMVSLYRVCDRDAPWRSAGCFDADERNFLATLEQVVRTTPDSSVVVVAKDAPFAMLARRRVVIVHDALMQDTTTFFDYLERNAVKRLVLTHISFLDDELSVRLLEVCRRLVLESTIPPLGSVYSWTQASAAASDSTGPACTELRRYRRESKRLI